MEDIKPFELTAMSDTDYEDLIIEVLYEGEFCFLISQEQGFQNMRIAIQPRKNGMPWDFSVKALQKVLTKAAERLWELRKDEE